MIERKMLFRNIRIFSIFSFLFIQSNIKGQVASYSPMQTNFALDSLKIILMNKRVVGFEDKYKDVSINIEGNETVILRYKKLVIKCQLINQSITYFINSQLIYYDSINLSGNSIFNVKSKTLHPENIKIHGNIGELQINYKENSMGKNLEILDTNDKTVINLNSFFSSERKSKLTFNVSNPNDSLDYKLCLNATKRFSFTEITTTLMYNSNYFGIDAYKIIGRGKRIKHDCYDLRVYTTGSIIYPRKCSKQQIRKK